MFQYRRWLSRIFVIATLLVSLVLAHASGAKAQASPNDHFVIGRSSLSCMGVFGFGYLDWIAFIDGAPIVQSQCSFDARQTWSLRPLDIHGNYQLVNTLSGKCLDGANGSVFQLSCSGTTSQVWRRFFVKSEFIVFFGQTPWYGLQNAQSQDFLAVPNGFNVVQEGFTGRNNQLWGFFNLQSGRFAGI
jgi:hypothetical protein